MSRILFTQNVCTHRVTITRYRHEWNQYRKKVKKNSSQLRQKVYGLLLI